MIHTIKNKKLLNMGSSVKLRVVVVIQIFFPLKFFTNHIVRTSEDKDTQRLYSVLDLRVLSVEIFYRACLEGGFLTELKSKSMNKI